MYAQNHIVNWFVIYHILDIRKTAVYEWYQTLPLLTKGPAPRLLSTCCITSLKCLSSVRTPCWPMQSSQQEQCDCRWRVLTGLLHNITLFFMITGHTKFSPDWCFWEVHVRWFHICVSILTKYRVTCTFYYIHVYEVQKIYLQIPAYEDWRAT